VIVLPNEVGRLGEAAEVRDGLALMVNPVETAEILKAPLAASGVENLANHYSSSFSIYFGNAFFAIIRAASLIAFSIMSVSWAFTMVLISF
jgi:hypothetical protein